jgi:hypothetical protein
MQIHKISMKSESANKFCKMSAILYYLFTLL